MPKTPGNKALAVNQQELNQGNLLINGRSYTVVRHEPSGTRKEVYYILTGARGAIYCTMRNLHHPHQMFLYGTKLCANSTMSGVWLTDLNGELRQI